MLRANRASFAREGRRGVRVARQIESEAGEKIEKELNFMQNVCFYAIRERKSLPSFLFIVKLFCCEHGPKKKITTESAKTTPSTRPQMQFE